MRRLFLLLTWLIALPIGMLAQGTTWQTATTINSGETKEGSLNKDREDDWYKIVVPEEGTVEFTVTPGGSLNIDWIALEWLNKNNEPNNFNSTGVGTGKKVLTTTNVGKGTYYIQIHRYTGNGTYTLDYQFTPCPLGNDAEPNDEYDKGALLESDKTAEGRLGYRDATNYTDNDDWYRIEVPEEGTVELTIDPNQENGLNIDWIALEWLNENNEPTNFNSTGVGAGKKVLTTTNVGKGTYYIRIHRYTAHGGYTLKYVFTPCPLANDAEPNDEYDKGALLESDKTAEGRLGYRDATNYTDNDDWYRIEVPEEGTVELTIDPNQENGLNIDWIALEWLNGENEPVNFNSTGVGTQKKVLTTTNVGKGTYYIRIHRYTAHGGYTLKYVFIPCPLGNDAEPNDEYDKGALLESDKTAEGRLGYRDATDYTDNDDWYRIEVPEEGTVELTIDPNQENGLNIDWIALEWLNENNEPTNFNSTGVGTQKKVFTTTNVGKGTYYIRIHRYTAHGGYTLKYVFTPCPLGNDAEPNDEYDKGALLESGKTAEGRLGYRDATDYTDNDDWYRIEVPDDGTVELTIDPNQENGLNIDWIALKWLNDKNETVNFNSTGVGVQKKVLTTTNVGKGTYYIQIHRYTAHGGYTLKYVFTKNPYIGDEEPNDTYEQAQTLVKGERVMAHLGYTDATNYTDNDDWYKFDVDIIGTPSLTIVPNQSYGLNIDWIAIYRLNDGEPKLVKSTGVGRNQATMYLPYYDKGTYYVQVHRYTAHGGYTLLYDEEPIRYFDDEPNDEFAQAIIINDGETKVGNIGFKKDEETFDVDDWFKVNVEEGSQLMFSYDPDQGEGIDATLYLYYYENGALTPVTVKYNQGSIKEGTGAWAHLQSLNIMTDENMKGGTYYLQLHRNSGIGTYTMTFNIPRRTLDSKVRVHYIGWPSVRKGIPGSFDITVENTGSTPSGSFLLCIPYSEDIKLLSAYLPDNQGGRTIDASEMSDEEQHNAVLVFPGLNPHEKYTFTVWAEGYVEGKYDARGVSKIEPVTMTILGIMAIHFISDVADSMIEDNIKSGLAHLVNTTLQDEETTREFANAYGVAEDDIRVKKEEYNMCAHGFKTVLKKTGESVNEALGLGVVNKVMNAIEDLKSVADAARRKFMVKYGRAAYLNKLMEEFENGTEIMDEETGANNIVSSWDPNEMVGPVGYGDENYIGGEAKTINYRILFENKAEATAPAYRIRITDELDEKVFDVSSVRFGGTSHDEVGTGWKMKRDGNKLSWDIEGIELPPNVNAPEGEGYVTFSVDLKPGLSNLAQIKNMATIVFDYNDPIETNEYVNTLDLKKPVGTMTSAFCSGSNVKLNCKGSDEESGIARYKFFAAKGDGEFELIGESSTTELEYTLPEGENAKDYKFAVAAVDNVGNTQETLSAAIAATEGVYGDVTGDGNVNGQDIQALINAIVSESTDPKYDVNEDGKINGQDIQVLINIIVASN